jgi:hypothetical protein
LLTLLLRCVYRSGSDFGAGATVVVSYTNGIYAYPGQPCSYLVAHTQVRPSILYWFPFLRLVLLTALLAPTRCYLQCRSLVLQISRHPFFSFFVLPFCITDLQVRCTTAKGVGVGHHFTLTVAGQSGSTSVQVLSKSPLSLLPLLSGAIPVLAVLAVPVCTWYLLSLIAVLIPAVNVVACAACLHAQSTSLCLMLILALRMCSVTCLPAQSASYTAPLISNVAIAGGTMSTVGGEPITLTGTNFGPTSGHVVAVGYATSVPLALAYTALSCAVTSDSVSVLCLTANGVGAGHAFTITVGGQASPASVSSLPEIRAHVVF